MKNCFQIPTLKRFFFGGKTEFMQMNKKTSNLAISKMQKLHTISCHRATFPSEKHLAIDSKQSLLLTVTLSDELRCTKIFIITFIRIIWYIRFHKFWSLRQFLQFSYFACSAERSLDTTVEWSTERNVSFLAVSFTNLFASFGITKLEF